MTREQELAVRVVDLSHDIHPFEFTLMEELEMVIDIYHDFMEGNFDNQLEALRYEKECIDDEIDKINIQDLIDDIEELKKDKEGK